MTSFELQNSAFALPLGARKDRIEAILESLQALGHARQVEGEVFSMKTSEPEVWKEIALTADGLSNFFKESRGVCVQLQEEIATYAAAATSMSRTIALASKASKAITIDLNAIQTEIIR